MRCIATFLAIVAGLSAIVYAPIIAAGSIDTAGGIFTLLGMWVPAIAAFLTCRIHHEPLRSLGWHPGKPRYLAFALFNAVYSGIGGLAIVRLAGDARLARIAWASFSLGTAVASLVWGNLVTRLGRKLVLVIGLAVGTVGMGCVALARGPRPPLATAFLGVEGAAVLLTAVLLVRTWYSQPRLATHI